VKLNEESEVIILYFLQDFHSPSCRSRSSDTIHFYTTGPIPTMGNRFAFLGLNRELEHSIRDDNKASSSEVVRPAENKSVKSEIKRSLDSTNSVSKSDDPACYIIKKKGLSFPNEKYAFFNLTGFRLVFFVFKRKDCLFGWYSPKGKGPSIRCFGNNRWSLQTINRNVHGPWSGSDVAAMARVGQVRYCFKLFSLANFSTNTASIKMGF